MSRQTFPLFCDQPGLTLRNFRITGASVGGSPGTAGLDGRGANLCTISQSANVFTVNWTAAFGDVPYVFFQPSAGQNNTIVQIISSTSRQLVFEAWEADDNTTPIANPNLDVLVCSYNTTSFVS
jgi:hypothetical protein